MLFLIVGTLCLRDDGIDIPESLAFCLSLGLLFILCLPASVTSDWKHILYVAAGRGMELPTGYPEPSLEFLEQLYDYREFPGSFPPCPDERPPPYNLARTS